MADMFGNEPDETIPQEQNPNYDNQPYDFNAPRDVTYEGLTPTQEDAFRRYRDLYGQGPQQDFALQGMQNVFGTIPRAQYDTETQASQLRRLGDRYLQGYMDRPSYTMGTLERDYPDMYRRPEDITTGDINPYMERVTSDNIDPYLERVRTRGIDTGDISRFQDPFQQQVVRGALSEFDEGVDRAANMRRARQAGAGAFGSRTDLANQQVDADIARQRGNLAGGLLSQGYGQALDTAVKQAGIGQQADIRDQLTMLAGGRDQLGRNLSAEQLNQAMRLRGGENQLSRELTALQNQARNEMARTQFDVDSAYRGDQQRLGAIDRRQGLERDIAGLAQQRANLSGLLGGMGTDYGRGYRDMFDMGTSQFTQPFSMLDFSTAFFGNKGYEDVDTAQQRELERRTSETEGKTSFGFGF